MGIPTIKVDRLTVGGTASGKPADSCSELCTADTSCPRRHVWTLQTRLTRVSALQYYFNDDNSGTSNQQATDLKELATDVVHRAMKGGATAAECVVREGDEFSTVVRLGQVETLKESGSRAIGVRVFFGQRAASTYSSDFSAAGIERMFKSALELAKIIFRRSVRRNS